MRGGARAFTESPLTVAPCSLFRSWGWAAPEACSRGVGGAHAGELWTSSGCYDYHRLLLSAALPTEKLRPANSKAEVKLDGSVFHVLPKWSWVIRPPRGALIPPFAASSVSLFESSQTVVTRFSVCEPQGLGSWSLASRGGKGQIYEICWGQQKHVCSCLGQLTRPPCWNHISMQWKAELLILVDEFVKKKKIKNQ